MTTKQDIAQLQRAMVELSEILVDHNDRITALEKFE